MEFDEYEYLEKTVESADLKNHHAAAGEGGNGNTERSERDGRDGGSREGRDRRSSYKRRSDDDGHDHRSKRNRAEEEEQQRERGERDSSRGGEKGLEKSERDRERSSHRRDGGGHGEERERVRERGVEKERERGERDGEKERGSRSRSEKTREKVSDRGEGGGERAEKEVRRSQGREMISEKKSEKERSREKDRERDKDRDRDRDRDRSRGRSRESDRHSRGKEKDREREKEKEREKEALREKEREREREREKEREREHRRRSRELKERKEEPPLAEPEADPERDQRTVFAYQISLKADERDVYDFFSRAGKVRDVRLIMDRNSRRSKGVGYIEFYDAMSVPMAIALSGQLLLNQPVMVKPSEAEKNLVQSTTVVPGVAGGFIGPYSGGARRLYVGNLHFNMTEDQLRQVFEPFGPVELVQLPADIETGQSKGFGFVQYARLEDARAAQQSLNGLELAGRPIKVSAVSDQIGMEDMGVHPGELDDDEGGGLSLNARSRALLMQKLDRSGSGTSGVAVPLATSTPAPALGLLGTAVPPAGAPLVRPPFFVQNPLVLAGAPPALGAAVLGSPGLVVPPVVGAIEAIGPPSEFLLLKNMFDPSSEADPEFDLDIKEDVQEECSKFGAVKHIFVDKNSAGHVYLCFDSTSAASAAQRALHGRWFAGKMITATYMTALAYQTKFPESK